jgi:hypothetical protein
MTKLVSPPQHPGLLCGHPSLLCNEYGREFPPGIKRSCRGTDCSPPSFCGIKNVAVISPFPIYLHGVTSNKLYTGEVLAFKERFWNDVPKNRLIFMWALEYHVRFEALTAVTMKNAVFWDVTQCAFCKNRRFGGTHRFQHHGKKSAC